MREVLKKLDVFARVTPEVDEIDKPSEEDVSSENATFFNDVRMSRVGAPWSVPGRAR